MAEVGEIIRLTVRHSAPNYSQMLNVFHHIVEGSSSTDEDVLDGLEAWITLQWAPRWAELASDNSEMEDASVDVVNIDGTVARAIGVFTIAVLGLDLEAVLPAANSAYILLKTIVPKVKGIKYLSGLSENTTENGEFTLPTIATMALMLAEYAVTLPIGGGTDLVPGVPSKSQLAFVPFLDTGILETIPAYQRRRKPNVGS